MSRDHGTEPIRGSIFAFLAEIFAKHRVQAILVGGYALNANKVQRMTFDIDFLLAPEGYEAIEPDLRAIGYEVAHRQGAFVQLRDRCHGMRDIDFLLSDPDTVIRLAAGGRAVRIAGRSFIVPSPIHLIAMKLHSITGNRKRELKDFPDIVQLMVANGIDPQSEELRALFDTYGTPSLYRRAVDAARRAHG